MGVIRLPVVSSLALAALVAAAAPLEAQYFGRNKVEYTEFAFRILRTEHFDIYYYPREAQAARHVARMAERWYVRFARLLDHDLDGRQPLVLYGSQAEFAQTNVVRGILPDTVGGVTEPTRRRIAMPLAPTLAETHHILGHEIVHAFQYDIGRRHGHGGQPGWFIEGMAEYLSRGPTDPRAGLWLRDLAATDRLPSRPRDAASQLSPYQFGHAFWAYLAGRFGDEVTKRALTPPKRGRLDDRLRHATGMRLEELYADWRADVLRQFRPHDGARASATAVSEGPQEDLGRIQLGPALSPDGRQAVLFSERDRFALELFLVDASTGRVIRKLATTTTSARFDSLQPLRSTGAWSPDGGSFVFPVVREGRAALVVLDMRRPGRDREIAFPALGQVLSPAWSPDGRTLAFSALAGGATDLYAYDLATGALRQLTDDPYADLQPAWSPDGRTIAIATERYTSDLETLTFGQPRLAAVDVASAAMRPLPALSDDAHVNPQWGHGGRSIFFVANPDGRGRVFRLDLEDDETHEVAASSGSVGGLTPTSPAISLASEAPVLASVIYRGGRYHLHLLRGEDVLGVERPVEPRSTSRGEAPAAGLLPTLLADHHTGLPDPATLSTHDYSPRLSLEGIGQPYVSSGGGAFGTFVRGGGSLLFGDMLGERRAGVAIQIGNRLRDAAFQVRFLNQQRRWNWGAIAELEPSLRRYRRVDSIEHDGQPALVKHADYLQRVQLHAAGILAYPFSRATRVEFTAGLRHGSYHHERRAQVVSTATGRVLDDARVELAGQPATLVAEAGAAIVGDNALFGPTGPLAGSRYRVEVAPTLGNLAYTRVLADYRRYDMPVRPVTLATRVLHTGRYGRDGEDPRLLSTFLGSRYFVRGHRLDARHCQPDPERVCGGELIGNRLLVGNVEVRAPLWGLATRELDYGPVPADVFLFADAGLIWSADGRGLDPRSRGGSLSLTRHRISSIGGGVRVNAGGLPVEVAAVRALDGAARGWSFDLGFRVGF